MSNTHNHAAKHYEGIQTWWASVYADRDTSRVCYTFLDTGVGIFRSREIGLFRRIYIRAGFTDNVKLLKLILEGGVESRTELPYRGKGLPAIKRRSKNGQIRSLIIISNDVYANIETGDYRLLPREFPGTLLYWEGQ
jgi:hypothetical protein